MKKLLTLLLVVVFSLSLSAQQGGMWIPSLLKGMNETEMKKLGMKMSVSDIYDVNKSSLKDAIAHFNGGCTSEVISPKGLLLTNHHCGYGEIQSHSTVENDYLEHGFWAKSFAEELPNEDLEVTFIIKIEDVTSKVLQGVDELYSEQAKQSKIKTNIEAVQKSFSKETWQETKVRDFFDGNQYLLFVTETYTDIRLVGAPPSSIGKFGSDTDNWVWPRHTGDFALFRIYADKNNRPAKYAKDNIPYTPKHYLPVSIAGVEQDDFTMVFGFPGRTQEYLPSYAVEQIIEDLNPARIELRDQTLKVADAYMRQDAAIKIQYASKYARIANAWKKWIGESQGLKQTNAVAIKKEFEKEFQSRVEKKNKQEAYGNLLNDFERLYKEITPYAVARDYFQEIVLRNNELLTIGFQLYHLEKTLENRGEQSYQDRKSNLISGLEATYKDYNAQVDQGIFEKLINTYAHKAPEGLTPAELKHEDYHAFTEQIYTTSALSDFEKLKTILQKSSKETFVLLNKDKGYQIAKLLSENYYTNIAPTYDSKINEINALQRTYMKAQLELFPDARIFPDANSTLRITYGKVDGYEPRDAVKYEHTTYLEGVMEKYIPGDYEFDVPEKLRKLYETKDYGKYADKSGKLPVNFIGTNHTTGGNSGSPALDAHGNLVGLNFDRVWEGTMSDIHYDPSICRNIMVDARYILFIIDKYAGANHLIEEIKIVNSKGKKK